MTRFYKIIEKSNLKYLVCNDDEDVNIEILVPIWENILKEYEKLTGSNQYSNHLRKMANDASKVNRLNGIAACYYLVKYSHPDAQKFIDYWKIPNTIEGISLLIRQEQTRLKILNERNKKDAIQETVKFQKLVVNAENSLGRSLDIENISVEKWVFICKSIEEKVKAYEKVKANGRQNNGTRFN